VYQIAKRLKRMASIQITQELNRKLEVIIANYYHFKEGRSQG
jgi:hypothetical protein